MDEIIDKRAFNEALEIAQDFDHNLDNITHEEAAKLAIRLLEAVGIVPEHEITEDE